MRVAFLTAGGLAPCLSSSIAYLIQEYSKLDIEVEFFAYQNGYKGLLLGNIISIPNLLESSSETADSVPTWIKNNAGWWAEGQIDDNSFVQGIEYLVKVGIIQVN